MTNYGYSEPKWTSFGETKKQVIRNWAWDEHVELLGGLANVTDNDKVFYDAFVSGTNVNLYDDTFGTLYKHKTFLGSAFSNTAAVLSGDEYEHAAGQLNDIKKLHDLDSEIDYGNKRKRRNKQNELSNTSYSGCDITASITVGDKTFVLGNIATLSYSIHRGKIPVRTLGRTYPKSYVSSCFAESEIIQTSDGLKCIKDISINDNILSYDLNNDNIEYKQCTNIFNNGKQDVKIIRLQDGSSQKLTDNHRIYIVNKGYIKVQNVELGDECIVNTYYDYNGTEIDIPDEYIKLLAYAIGDGVFGLYKNGNETRFSLTPGNNDEHIIQEELSILNKLNLKYSHSIRNNCHNITLKNTINGRNSGDHSVRPIHEFIKWTRELNIYGLKSHQKYIPDDLINMSNRQLSIFLSRLFSTDGHVSSKGNNIQIGYCSTSLKLIKQIKQLLKRFNIDSYISYKGLPKSKLILAKHDAYALSISLFDNYKFIQSIGIFSKKHKYEPIIDVIYNLQLVDYKLVKKFIKIKGRKQAELLNPCIPKHGYLRYKTIVKNMGIEFAKEFVSKYGFFERPNTKTSKIIHIEDDSNINTYDIEVDSNHNIFGDFLSHNSRTIAGTLIFTVFDTHVLHEVRKAVITEVEANGTQSSPLTDQLPPFDITIIYQNEHNSSSYMRIYGIEISDESQTHSVNDIYTENVMQYVARDIDLMVNEDDEWTPQAFALNNAFTQGSMSTPSHRSIDMKKEIGQLETLITIANDDMMSISGAGNLTLDTINEIYYPPINLVEYTNTREYLIRYGKIGQSWTSWEQAANWLRASINESKARVIALKSSIQNLDNNLSNNSELNLGSRFSQNRDSPYSLTRKKSLI